MQQGPNPVPWVGGGGGGCSPWLLPLVDSHIMNAKDPRLLFPSRGPMNVKSPKLKVPAEDGAPPLPQPHPPPVLELNGRIKSPPLFEGINQEEEEAAAPFKAPQFKL